MRKSPQQIVDEFNKHHFHDDILLNITISPSELQRRYSKIVFDLDEDCTGKLRQLTLSGCANISMIADFDVLKDNAGSGNTEWIDASCDSEKITTLLESQIDRLNIEYDDGAWTKHPTKVKISDPKQFVLFRFKFFGGIAEVLARNFKINRPRKLKTG